VQEQKQIYTWSHLSKIKQVDESSLNYKNLNDF
jgi:hypothetical protein